MNDEKTERLMMSRNALGKGLEALIPQVPSEPVKTEEQPKEGYVHIGIDKLYT